MGFGITSVAFRIKINFLDNSFNAINYCPIFFNCGCLSQSSSQLSRLWNVDDFRFCVQTIAMQRNSLYGNVVYRGIEALIEIVVKHSFSRKLRTCAYGRRYNETLILLIVHTHKTKQKRTSEKSTSTKYTKKNVCVLWFWLLSTLKLAALNPDNTTHLFNQNSHSVRNIIQSNYLSATGRCSKHQGNFFNDFEVKLKRLANSQNLVFLEIVPPIWYAMRHISVRVS